MRTPLRRGLSIQGSDMTDYRSQAANWILASGALAVLLIYLPGLSHYLAFDDYPHIVPLYQTLQHVTPTSLWEAIWSSNSGPTGRPLAMATFAIQIGFFGAGPVQLKVANLLLHLLTGIVLYRLGTRILTVQANAASPSSTYLAPTVAAFAAVLWLVHPLQLTTVAYTVQRMNGLSALFMVLALHSYVRLRTGNSDRRDWNAGLIRIALLWICGVLSKETAILLPVYIVVLECTVLPGWEQLTRRVQKSRAAMAASAIVLVVGVIVVAAGIHWILPGYDNRPFTVGERLLTEFRALAWYLRLLLVPDNQQMSLLHDDWTLSRSILQPVTTLPALLIVAGLLYIGWRTRRRAPLISFGIFWFFGGHLLESTIVPLELVFEHRNYLPIFGPILAITAYAAKLANRRYVRKTILLAGFVAVFASLSALTYSRAQRWSDDPGARLAHFEMKSGSFRAQIEAAQIYEDQARQAGAGAERERMLGLAERHFIQASRISRDNAEPLFGWILFRAKYEPEKVQPLMEHLIPLLRTQKLSSTSVNGIHALTKCVARQLCTGLKDELPEVFRAALENPYLDVGRRSSILRNRGYFEFFVQHSYREGIRSMHEAFTLNPHNLETGIELTYMLAAVGEKSAALHVLQTTESKDSLRRMRYSTSQLRDAILTGRISLPNRSNARAEPRPQ